MKSKIQIILTSVFLCFALVSSVQAFQLVNCGTQTTQSPVNTVQPGTQQSNECKLSDLLYGVIFIVNFLIGSATWLAIGFIVYGGVRMILARGNPAAIDEGKRTIYNSIIGLVIIFMAYIIVTYILTVLTGGTFTLKNATDIISTLPGLGK
jgi:hypothetical protein